ncbi:c-type cytochrome [Variovorax saccharolyticus]|uniref:c-type cytochrome n=1 Tax=Variovorax saccharolyticus TaxID=3053516 RepID=UPI00257877C0|nr:c-type cytochrome [Variovorax sp. J22R187]MDM0017340.1 c-type cytochrome [Variovorax sp. J22R187]
MRLTTVQILAGLLLLLSGPASAQDPVLVQALARKNGCMACHGMVHKQVGPGFAQVAERYRDDPTAPGRLAGRIRDGSVGTWGRVIMPRQSQLSEAQAKLLAQWVLVQPPP